MRYFLYIAIGLVGLQIMRYLEVQGIMNSDQVFYMACVLGSILCFLILFKGMKVDIYICKPSLIWRDREAGIGYVISSYTFGVLFINWPSTRNFMTYLALIENRKIIIRIWKGGLWDFLEQLSSFSGNR